MGRARYVKWRFSQYREPLAEVADPLLRAVLEASAQCTGEGEPLVPMVEDGVEFWHVGHNASHDFYLGVKDGVLYKLSMGEDWDPDTHEAYCRKTIRVITDGKWGYIGHW